MSCDLSLPKPKKDIYPVSVKNIEDPIIGFKKVSMVTQKTKKEEHY
jgi:hypothetical protein